MSRLPEYMTPDHWLLSVFSAKAVNRGGVIRRRVRDVERWAGRDRFLAEVARRGFQVLENNGHFIVLCNAAPVHQLRYDGQHCDMAPRRRSADGSCA